MALSTFLGLETALRGILAQQRAIDITGHNIANASTPGYSRQTATLVTTAPFQDTPSGLLGTGVDVQSYQRVRDQYVDVQLRSQMMLKGSYQAQQDGLNQVELTLNEPSDNGLSSLLSKYWAAWQNVTNAPSDMATRQALVQSAQSLAAGFNSLSSQLTTIATQTTQQQNLTVTQVNSIGTQIAALNGSIKAAELAGQQPNDLLDQRDSMLDTLHTLGNVSFAASAGSAGQLGAIDVTFGGQALVTDTTASTLTLAGITPTSGQLAGMQSVLTSINDPATGYLKKLNDVASALITSTNTQHALGTDLNGNAGGAFFSGTDASSIAVTAGVLANPALVAAANGAATPANPAPGDASNAIKLADIQQSLQLGGPPATTTIDQAYSQLVTTIGSDSQQATQNLSNATALVNALTNQRSSISGVSLDEEMAKLLQYQRGFQASARALTAMDDMVDQLINRTGKVGM